MPKILDDVLLKVDNLGKNFSGNIVLKDINFVLKKGEILGLVGENGAGKSTLMKILFGMPEIGETGGYTGSIYFNSKKLMLKSPNEALEIGIGMVHQEFSLIPGFNISENIKLNMEKTKPSILSNILGKRLDMLDISDMKHRAKNALELLGLKFNLSLLAEDLPVGHKQFLEIAREIDRDNIKLLILDEPTAVLTESEASILLKAIKKLSGLGVSIIFISHRLNEIKEVGDKVLVLRDGIIAADMINDDSLSVADIAELMVGRNVDTVSVKRNKRYQDTNILEVKNLWVKMQGEEVADVSFAVKKGEIFGIGGLAGQGKLGIPNGIMGLCPSGGQIMFEGKRIKIGEVYNNLVLGMAFVSEDRKGVGLILDEPVYWNIAFNSMQVKNKFIKKVAGLSFRDEDGMRVKAREYVSSLQIKCTGERQLAGTLSGGNQQKVCLAAAFELNPKLLFVSEPTRGIDIGAKMLVLDALRHYNNNNDTTIVIVSSELEELRSICDMIAIICEGKVSGIVPPDTSARDFGLLMSGELEKEGVKS